MPRDIGYNSQRNNFNFAGKFSGWSQCFSTSSWMFLSYYCDGIKADDDKGLMNFVDDVEAMVGKPGIAEKVKKKFPEVTGFTSLFWKVQKEAIEKYMWLNGNKGNAIFHDADFPAYSLASVLKDGPVIIGTNKMGGLNGGHINLISDFDDERRVFLVNDPVGNARQKYADHDGHNVLYPYDWYLKYIVYKKPDNVRCIFWDKK